MSLNSVVNNLVRAAAGIPADISDTDLDQHVAALLAKEAKEREMKWSEIGLGGLLGSSSERDTPDPNAPKPNKRFLASVIRTVDTHNSSVIRQQLEAAETARSNAGMGESSRSAASRMFGGAMRDAAGSGKGKGRARDRDRDRGRAYDSRGRDKLEEDRRWHDKRQASRERRTRYDVAEEEEMYNTGADTLPERKERQDWIKRKEERDKRKREEREDEESERRRRDLYGDDEGGAGRRAGRRSRSPPSRKRRDTSRDEEERTAARRDADDSSDRRRRYHRGDDTSDGERKDRRPERSSKRDAEDGSSGRRRHREDTGSEDERRKDESRRRRDREREAVEDEDAEDRKSRRREKDEDRHRDRSPRRHKASNGEKDPDHSDAPGKLRSTRKDTIDPPLARRKPTSSPSPGPPPPPDMAPPPPDSPPPPPPPPGASKMDKYFKADYDPRLDLGDVPRDGYVPEVGWDNMLAILKERGKKPRNRSPGLYDDPLEIPKVHLRRTPSPTAKEIEKAERRAKRAARGFDDDFETEAERAKRKAERKKEKEERARVTQLGPGDGGGLFDVSYVKKGGVREWDMGK